MMFKPKQREAQQQPFYLSWFSQQGDNMKRGGTAPQQDRKERLSIKSPYQQPLTSLVSMNTNQYVRTTQQVFIVIFDRPVVKPFQSSIQQISKIYTGQQFMKPRKSQEMSRPRYEAKQTRAFTQQQQVRPKRQPEEIRPSTQQKVEEMMELETEPQEVYAQEIYLDNDDSNLSQEADSEGDNTNQIPTIEQQPNRSYYRDLDPKAISNIRPMTSEGGRRKKFIREDTKPIEEQPEWKDVASMRSMRNKGETTSFNRPPSRHKTPPKAIDLEIPPVQNHEIPIKNMYAHMEEPVHKNIHFDESDGFEIDFQKINWLTETEPQAKHPQSASLKLGNLAFSPMNGSIKPQTAMHSDLGAEIIIKHNTSTAIPKSNAPVKVPFQTSLGQDFLRLFANNY